MRRRFFALTLRRRAHEIVVCALRLLATEQGGGEIWRTRFRRVCRSKPGFNITNEPRMFIEVDNQEAVKIGHLERYEEVLEVVRPKFNRKSYPEAYIRDECAN